MYRRRGTEGIKRSKPTAVRHTTAGEPRFRKVAGLLVFWIKPWRLVAGSAADRLAQRPADYRTVGRAAGIAEVGFLALLQPHAAGPARLDVEAADDQLRRRDALGVGVLVAAGLDRCRCRRSGRRCRGRPAGRWRRGTRRKGLSQGHAGKSG